MTKEALTAEADGKLGVVLVLEILFHNNRTFLDFCVIWTEQYEPNPIDVTEAMILNNGLPLLEGGILSWDKDAVTAMIVRLKEYVQKEKSEPAESV